MMETTEQIGQEGRIFIAHVRKGRTLADYGEGGQETLLPVPGPPVGLEIGLREDDLNVLLRPQRRFILTSRLTSI